MIDFLKKTGSGFALGLGFTAAMIFVYYIWTVVMIEQMFDEDYQVVESQLRIANSEDTQSDRSDLVVKGHKERKIANGVEILAQVENTGEGTWENVIIEVEFFDPEDQFVDECSEYTKGNIGPNEIKNVKIRCGGCKSDEFPDYSSYVITVEKAYAR